MSKVSVMNPVERFVMRSTPLRMIFCRNISAGDVYYFNEFNKSDPFKSEPHRVKVLDVKSGYVQFDWINSSVGIDSMTISQFLFCYILDE